jgi:uncharacterized protein (TIGR02266 family)
MIQNQMVSEATRLPLEARAATRIDLTLEVGVETDHNFFVGLAENISEGGVFVATHNLRELGSILTVHLALPGHERPICATCEVRWVRIYNEASDTPPGMGLRFLDLDAPDELMIREFVETRAPLFWE